MTATHAQSRNFFLDSLVFVHTVLPGGGGGGGGGFNVGEEAQGEF